MKITRVSAFQVDLSLAEGPCKWSGGNTVSVFDGPLVRVGRLAAPSAPGLGLTPRPDVPGEPVLVVEQPDRHDPD